MKKLLLATVFLWAAGCSSRYHTIQPTIGQPGRFTAESYDVQPGPTFTVIHDTKTGREYIVTLHHGVSKIEED